jgi:hypothetical protein
MKTSSHTTKCAEPCLIEGEEEEKADLDENGGSIAWNRIQGRMYDLIDQISEHKPATVAGVAVLMRAFVLENEEWWGADNEEYARLRAGLGPICSFLNIKPAPIQEAELIAQEEG